MCESVRPRKGIFSNRKYSVINFLVATPTSLTVGLAPPSHQEKLAMASRDLTPDPPAPKKSKKVKDSSWIDEAHFGEKSSTSDSGEKFTFFFGKDSPFSQWHPAQFKVDTITYNCAEQYMMHQKAVLFGDDAMATDILKTDDPKEQKGLGRKVSNFDPAKWNEECKTIVKTGNLAKV